MAYNETFIHGRWKAVCDRCGFFFKSSQIRREWTGLRVCSGGGTNRCFEERHPQDYVRGKKDQQSPKWTRPDTEGRDVSPGSGNEVSASDL